MTQTIERIENWDVALNEYIASMRDEPFGYGTNDCCVFTAGGVLAITGTDYMEEFRGHYGDEDSSNIALASIGSGNLFKTLTRKFGKSLKGVYGRKGDIAFYDGCCGIVLGRVAIFIRSEGYGVVPISQVERIFRIGN